MTNTFEGKGKLNDQKNLLFCIKTFTWDLLIHWAVYMAKPPGLSGATSCRSKRRGRDLHLHPDDPRFFRRWWKN